MSTPELLRIERMEAEMYSAYRIACRRIGADLETLLSSKKQAFSDIRHAVRGLAWERWGCSYSDIAAAEEALRGKPMNTNVIAYSIRQWLHVVKPQNPGFARQMEADYHHG